MAQKYDQIDSNMALAASDIDVLRMALWVAEKAGRMVNGAGGALDLFEKRPLTAIRK